MKDDTDNKWELNRRRSETANWVFPWLQWRASSATWKYFSQRYDRWLTTLPIVTRPLGPKKKGDTGGRDPSPSLSRLFLRHVQFLSKEFGTWDLPRLRPLVPSFTLVLISTMKRSDRGRTGVTLTRRGRGDFNPCFTLYTRLPSAGRSPVCTSLDHMPNDTREGWRHH